MLFLAFCHWRHGLLKGMFWDLLLGRSSHFGTTRYVFISGQVLMRSLDFLLITLQDLMEHCFRVKGVELRM